MQTTKTRGVSPVGEAGTPVCPRCMGRDVVPIRYGYSARNEEGPASMEGLAFFGGYYVDYDSPEWHCLVCQHEFGRSSVTL